MGTVYLARQLDLDRPVALKVISPELARDPAIVVRLNREARSAARVSSDNVVKVYETGAEGGVPFIAMEYVDGRSAASLLAERKRVPWREATAIVIAAARGLKAAHAVSVLHRDVKPANILIARDGSIKLADFGLAKEQTKAAPSPSAGKDPEATDKALSVAGGILGTPDYMSPEQADGATLGPTADIYALGVTYYELLSGTRPFGGGSFASTISHVMTGKYTALRERVAEVPPRVASLCARLMALEPGDRPQTVEEAIDLLEKLPSVSGRFTHDPDPVESAAPARPGLTAALAVSVLLLLAVVVSGGVWALHARPAAEPPAPPSPPAVAPPVALPAAPPPTPEPVEAPEPPASVPKATDLKPFPVRPNDRIVFKIFGTKYTGKMNHILGKGVEPVINVFRKTDASPVYSTATVWDKTIMTEKYVLEDDGRIRLKLYHGKTHDTYVLDGSTRATWVPEPRD
jgi:serine/threonine-protein kinase